ncbi:MAG: ABC transporter substrate-binding protein [bacterium]|nr:ABC transporter substrate-binding protein [bacterium]
MLVIGQLLFTITPSYHLFIRLLLNMNKTVIWVVVLIVVVGGIVMFSGKSAPTETGPIKIGVIAPMTGDAAAYGEPMANVLRMAVEEVNATGGVDGRLMELIVEDGKCSGASGTSAAQKLVNVDGVKAIIGGFCSGETIPAVPIVAAAKVVMVSGGASSPDLTGISPYFFRTNPSDSAQGKVLAQIAYNDKGWRKVAFLQEQTDYALGIYKAFNEEFVRLGGSTTNESFASNVTDVRGVITKAKATNPDALFISAQTPAVVSRVLTQVSQSNWKPALMVNDVVPGDPELLKNSSALLEGALTAEFGTNPQNPKFQTLVNNYKAKYGSEPPFQSYAQTMYDAVYLLKEGLAKAGEDGEKLAQWSRTIKNWDGASGKITILESGDRDSGHTMKVIRGGKVELYTK